MKMQGMNRKASLGLVVAGIAIGSLGALASAPPDFVVRAANAAVSGLSDQLNLFGEVFHRVRTDYVVQPDEKSMVTNALDGMVSGLDAQSEYFAPGDGARAAERPGDATATVGMLLTIDDSAAKVLSVADGSPAAAAGILAGDSIVAINGSDLAGVHLLDVDDALRCGDGKPVAVTLVRDGVNEPFTAKLQCAALPVTSVSARAEDGVGYVRVNRLTGRTADEIRSAVARLGTSSPKGYVLDLRNNPGGSLDAAVAASGDFLGAGAVVSLRGRDTAQDRTITGSGEDVTKGAPIVVLINGGSAAEAEIVAGALKDSHRATVLGARSSGTGSVQSVMPLGQDGTLRLTTARYYTPSGQKIEGAGITPDITVAQTLPPLPPSINAKQSPAKTAGAKAPADPAYIPGDPSRDKQLQYALELVRGTLYNPIFQPPPKKSVAG